jgi:hypothetical protein
MMRRVRSTRSSSYRSRRPGMTGPTSLVKGVFRLYSPPPLYPTMVLSVSRSAASRQEMSGGRG